MRPTISRILVPTDFSPPSDAAIAYASSLAQGLGASIHLVHVLEEPFVASGPYEFYSPDTPEGREQRYARARARLARIAGGLDAPPVRITVEIRGGRPLDAIVSAAADYEADLIVMGTHGRTGLEHLLLGSVAEQVLRTARCPVLAVRESPGEMVHPEAVLIEAAATT